MAAPPEKPGLTVPEREAAAERPPGPLVKGSW
jgi:hypothetical protein